MGEYVTRLMTTNMTAEARFALHSKGTMTQPRCLLRSQLLIRAIPRRIAASSLESDSVWVIN